MSVLLNSKRRLLMVAVACTCALLLGVIPALRNMGVPLPGGDTPTAHAADEGPNPGDAGQNPCKAREVQDEATTASYYILIGDTLREKGDPRFATFDGSKPEDIAWVTKFVVDTKAATPVPPGAPAAFDATTYWCPGWDKKPDGTTVERKPVLVSPQPLHYKQGKQYWVLYETATVKVIIFYDCDNLAIIEVVPTPETTVPVTTQPAPPPATTVPPESPTPTPPPPPPPEESTTTVKPHEHPKCPNGEDKPANGCCPEDTATPGAPVPENNVCPKKPTDDVNVNPDVPAQPRGPGQTPVGQDPGPPVAPVDSPTGCQGPCPTTAPTTATTVAAAGSGGSGDGTPLTTPGGNAGVSHPVPAVSTSVALPPATGDTGGFG